MLASSLEDFDVVMLDIEGTVCPITFVRDTLFPYALRKLPYYLDQHWDSKEFATYREAFPEEFSGDRVRFEDHVRDLVSRDVKAPYLKALQGLLWQAGYASGELKAPLFPDVGPFMQAACASGKKIFIYSSGSVSAQKLFFAHTNAQTPDLTPCVSAWFDTVNAGPKTEVDSYRKILSSYKDVAGPRWLFLSDNLAEVHAAIQSGMRSLPVARQGNEPLPKDNKLAMAAIPDFSPESEPTLRKSLDLLNGLSHE